MKPMVLPPVAQGRDRQVQAVAKFLMGFLPGKPVRVQVEEARADRTAKQNRYLFGVPYRLLSEATGYELQDLHEWFCGQQWGWVERRGPKTPSNPEGVYSRPARTTTTNEDGERDLCSREEFTALWERAQRVGAQIGVFIPDPDPDYWRQAKPAGANTTTKETA
jgi:hypothetical protein